MVGLPCGSDSKESACNVKNLLCKDQRRPSFDPWVGKIPWRRDWQPIPVFLPGEFHGQRSLASCSPWGCKESDMTEQLTHTHTHTHTHTRLGTAQEDHEDPRGCREVKQSKVTPRLKGNPLPLPFASLSLQFPASAGWDDLGIGNPRLYALFHH